MTLEEAEEIWEEQIAMCDPDSGRELRERTVKPVRIEKNDDMTYAEPIWVLVQEDGAWVGGFDTKIKALEFVEAMGWPLIDE